MVRAVKTARIFCGWGGGGVVGAATCRPLRAVYGAGNDLCEIVQTLSVCPKGRQHLSPAGTPPDIAYAMPSPKGRAKTHRTYGADGGTGNPSPTTPPPLRGTSPDFIRQRRMRGGMEAGAMGENIRNVAQKTLAYSRALWYNIAITNKKGSD